MPLFGVVVHQVKGAICHIAIHQDHHWSRNLQMKLHFVDETIELLIEKKIDKNYKKKYLRKRNSERTKPS